MHSEQLRVREVLELAVRIETEGKKFYERARRRSHNHLAKELFQQLVREEDVHRKKFEEIYKGFKKMRNWPDIEPPSDEGRTLKSLLAEAIKVLGSGFETVESEFEAIKAAMDMESQSYDLYHTRSEKSSLPLEKEFYEALAGEERGHYLVLVDSCEYFSDPVGWFTKKEHWSLDGV